MPLGACSSIYSKDSGWMGVFVRSAILSASVMVYGGDIFCFLPFLVQDNSF